MQQILIDSHKQNVQDIAQRFPRDVESYSKMMSVQTGLQTVINRITTRSILMGKSCGKIALNLPHSGRTMTHCIAVPVGKADQAVHHQNGLSSALVTS